MIIRDKIAGAIYGMALGDAMGMPSELWSKKHARDFFGKRIDSLLDGPDENEVARNYKRGQFTDDTAQGLVLIESIAATNYVPDTRDVALRLIAWAESVNAWENCILGPTSRRALANFRDGIEDTTVTDRALSNGSAMRIAPIGCLFTPDRKTQLVDYVFEVSRVTHSSNVAIAGAAMIAAGVSSAIVNDDFDKVIEDILEVEPIGYAKGFDFYTPRLAERVKLAINIADGCGNDEELFLQKIYDIIGTGVGIIEAVPAAIGIAYYARDPNLSCVLCANVGGDTDTIGAMATAICGAFKGLSAFDSENVDILRRQNDVNFENYIDILVDGRAKLA